MTQGYVPARRFPDAPQLSPDNPGRLIPAVLGRLPGALPGRAGTASPEPAARPVSKLVRETVPANQAGIDVQGLINGLPFGGLGGVTPPPRVVQPPAPIEPAPVTPPAAVEGAAPAPPPRVLTPPPGIVAELQVDRNGTAKHTPPMGVDPIPAPAPFVKEAEPPPMVGGPIISEAPVAAEDPPAAIAPTPSATPGPRPMTGPHQTELSPWMREAGQASFAPEPLPFQPTPPPSIVTAAPVRTPAPGSGRSLVVVLALIVVAVGAGAAFFFLKKEAPKAAPTQVGATATTTTASPPPTEPTAQEPGTSAPEPSATQAGGTLKSPPPPTPVPPRPGGYAPSKPTSTPQPAATPKFDPSGI
ncbi:MAG: hypothetical protein JNL21_02085 [Myxococcales bacterium]|nr:hypothetical protein [Myxococcales bacterium]